MIGRNARWLRPLLILYMVGPGRVGAVPGSSPASARAAPLPPAPPGPAGHG